MYDEKATKARLRRARRPESIFRFLSIFLQEKRFEKQRTTKPARVPRQDNAGMYTTGINFAAALCALAYPPGVYPRQFSAVRENGRQAFALYV